MAGLAIVVVWEVVAVLAIAVVWEIEVGLAIAAAGGVVIAQVVDQPNAPVAETKSAIARSRRVPAIILSVVVGIAEATPVPAANGEDRAWAAVDTAVVVGAAAAGAVADTAAAVVIAAVAADTAAAVVAAVVAEAAAVVAVVAAVADAEDNNDRWGQGR